MSSFRSDGHSLSRESGGEKGQLTKNPIDCRIRRIEKTAAARKKDYRRGKNQGERSRGFLQKICRRRLS